MRKFLIVVVALAFFYSPLFAQFQVRDSVLFDPHITMSMAYQWPGGDLANRFGNDLSLGLGFHIKTKSNWIYGAHGTFFFGDKVSEPGLLSNLKTDNGEILDDQGQIAVVVPLERGFTFSLDGGKLINVMGPNENSGLLLRFGAGYLRHKIRLEHTENVIAQLEGDYLKGYDRMCNGFMINQFVGYSHMSNNGRINFIIGFESYQAFTKQRRDMNFDTRTSQPESRFDILSGIRGGWVLHLYRRTPTIQYFN